MKQKRWVLYVVLLMAVLILSGCGIPREGVDVTQTDPDGLWQTLVVWPMARSLVWIDSALQSVGIPEHWGFSIILFTIFIRVLMLPLTFTQIRGMQAQKDLQPKIQELQKKYGKDREKMAQEQMKLYREAGVNPLSGCLPLIVQMPILFGLYSALIALSPNITNASFFWIPDLGFPRYTQGLSWIRDDFTNGDLGHLLAYLVLPALLMASQYSMQKWMTPATPSTGNNQQNMTKQIGTMMTLMFGFFTLQVPAGLSLYWVTSNLLQILQQWLITGGTVTPAAGSASSAMQTESDSDEQVVVSEGADNVTVEQQNGAKPTGATSSKNGSAPQSSTRSSRKARRRRRAKRK